MDVIFNQQIKTRRIATNNLANWQNLFITWIRQENSIIEFHNALKIIYPSTYELNEAEFRAWRAMLRACGCTDITPYPKSNDRKEFWSRSVNPTANKANLRMLYKLGCLQTNLEILEESDNIVTNNEYENIFWNSFRSALISNKRGGNGKTQILSIIANQFEYLQLHEKLQVRLEIRITIKSL